MKDIEAYATLVRPAAPAVLPDIPIVRLTPHATRLLLDNARVPVPCYFLIQDNGDIAGMSTDWPNAQLWARRQYLIIYNCRSRRCFRLGKDNKSSPVKLFLHRGTLDVHPYRTTRMTEYGNKTWEDRHGFL